ncbi:MAG: MBL fold metallo-hydrolase [Chitinophagaceae bacterium]
MQSNTRPPVSRADFIRTAGLVTAGTLFFPRKIFAQESPVITIINEAAKSPIVVQKLRGNISVLQGSGGNIAVFTGPDGKLMVDAGIAVSEQKIKAAMAKISNDPLKYLINTHWHFDHANGNPWVHQYGATIIAQENTRKNLSTTIRVKDWDYTFEPLPADGLPTIQFKQTHELDFNGTKIAMRYYNPAHTDCDISVRFPNVDIIHVADTWWNGYYPFIDHDSGGKLEGMINASDYNLANTTNDTIIIPGHGPVGNRKQLKEFRDMLVLVRDRVYKLKKSGKTLAETVAAKPTADLDAKWGKFVLDGAFFTKLVYADV